MIKCNSPFEITNVLPNDFRLMLKGNNAFAETKVEIIDDQNNVVFSKIPTNASITWDSIQLNDGCYSLLITDTDDDGISFWANNDGSGLLQLRAYNNTFLYVLEGDFGKYTRFNFSVNMPLSYEEIHGTMDVKVFPNPADNELHLQGENIEQAQINIIDALGKKIELPISKFANEVKLNTTSLANGFYFVKMQRGNQRSVQKVFIRH